MIIPSEVNANSTLVDFPRLEKLVEGLEQTELLEGVVAEVGVYKGGTALTILANTKKQVFLFDTFEGMPNTLSIDLHKKGDFSDTSIDAVDMLLKSHNNYAIYKGVFPQQNSEYVRNRKFSMVHLDVDIYTSVKECLEFFYPRMTPGGIIFLDDYNEVNCPGAKLAADEFARSHGTQVLPTVQSQAKVLVAISGR